MRVITGKYRGRRVDAVKGDRVRPTSDKVRTAIFNILNNMVEWEEVNFLDICCGTGAVGIEALSRGAKKVCFIDNHPESVECTRHNLEKIGEGKNPLLRASIDALPIAREIYNVVFIDPPYRDTLIPAGLKSLIEQKWIDTNSIVICEQSVNDKDTKIPADFEIFDERRYGNTKLCLIRLIGN